MEIFRFPKQKDFKSSFSVLCVFSIFEYIPRVWMYQILIQISFGHIRETRSCQSRQNIFGTEHFQNRILSEQNIFCERSKRCSRGPRRFVAIRVLCVESRTLLDRSNSPLKFCSRTFLFLPKQLPEFWSCSRRMKCVTRNWQEQNRKENERVLEQNFICLTWSLLPLLCFQNKHDLNSREDADQGGI